MQIIRDLNQRPKRWKGCVAAIGNFDGLHRGHQRVFESLAKLRQAHGLPLVAILFEPHPREYFSKETAPQRLSPFRDKVKQLEAVGVNAVVCLRFNASLANLPAEQFVEDILLAKLGVKVCAVGVDFRFGHKRLGDVGLLKRLGAASGMEVQVLPLINAGTEKISSTRIREALRLNQLSACARYLGRPYAISGRVKRGNQIGRTWGFPTINIAWPFAGRSLAGIYAVRVTGLEREPLMGAANVGTRPAVGGEEYLIEVHLFNYNQDCYGKRVTVEFIHWLREEKHFPNLDDLKAQIQCDVDNVKMYFAQTQTVTELA